jgi:hypothetical protein
MNIFKKSILIFKVKYWNYKNEVFPLDVKILESKIDLFKLKQEYKTVKLTEQITRNIDLNTKILTENGLSEELTKLLDCCEEQRKRRESKRIIE